MTEETSTQQSETKREPEPRNQDSIPAPGDYHGGPSIWEYFGTVLGEQNQGKRRGVSWSTTDHKEGHSLQLHFDGDFNPEEKMAIRQEAKRRMNLDIEAKKAPKY